MASRTLTLNAIVGANVRHARERLGWSQEDLASRLAEVGVAWSRPTVAQLELGKRGTTVDDLLVVALAVGVAPHVLLYPPAGVDVGVAGDGVLPGPDLAHWLWAPDDSPYTEPENEATERETWALSARVLAQISDEEAARLASEGRAKATGRAFVRSGIKKGEA